MGCWDEGDDVVCVEQRNAGIDLDDMSCAQLTTIADHHTNPNPFSLSWSRMMFNLFRYRIPSRFRSAGSKVSRSLICVFSTRFCTVCENPITVYPTGTSQKRRMIDKLDTDSG